MDAKAAAVPSDNSSMIILAFSEQDLAQEVTRWMVTNFGPELADAVEATPQPGTAGQRPILSLDFDRAQAFLTACETSVPRVTGIRPSSRVPSLKLDFAKPCACTQSCWTTEPSGNEIAGFVERRIVGRMKPLQST
jgi:hypothetical protein